MDKEEDACVHEKFNPNYASGSQWELEDSVPGMLILLIDAGHRVLLSRAIYKAFDGHGRGHLRQSVALCDLKDIMVIVSGDFHLVSGR